MRSVLLTLVLAAALCTGGMAQTYQSIGTATLPSPVGGSAFAQASCLDGNEVIMGSPYENGNKGQINFASKTGSTWTMTAAMAPGSLVANDLLGFSTTLFGQDAAANILANSSAANCKGSVVVYSKSSGTWQQVQQISAPWQRAGNSSNFAYTVAMDRNVMVMGAFDYDSITTNSGAAFIYEKISGVWVYKAIVRPTTLNASALFGRAISIRNGVIAIAAMQDNEKGTNAGAVYIYKKINGTWTLTQKLMPDNFPSETYYGTAVTQSADALAVTSLSTGTSKQGVAYMYQYTGSSYLLNTKLVAPNINYTPSAGTPAVVMTGTSGFIGSAGNNATAGSIFPMSFDGTKWIIGSEMSFAAFPSGSVQKGKNGTLHMDGENLLINLSSEAVNSIPNVGRMYFFQATALTATDTLSDAFVDVKWKTTLGCAHHISKPLYVQLYDATKGVELDKTILDSNWNYDLIEGSFRHMVKPGTTTQYELRMYEYGPGTPLCITAVDNGASVPYKKPTFAYNGSNLHRTDMGISNSSDYGTHVRLYRDNKLLKTFDKTTTDISDIYKFDDPTSIVNGRSYQYCLQNINSGNSDTSGRTCVVETTVPIGLSITNERNKPDAQATSKNIKLAWNDIMEYVSRIDVERDNVLVSSLDKNKRSFEDTRVIPGKAHIYTFVLYEPGGEIYRYRDTGSIRANGRLTGRITNNDKSFGLANVQVTITGTVEGKTYTYSTKTSATGAYQIDRIYYGESANYKITLKRGNVAFDNNNSTIGFSLSAPTQKADFKSNFSVNTQQTQTFTVSNFKVQNNDTADMIRLSWDHTQSDTVYYRINRDNELLDIVLAASGSNSSWSNVSGEPSKIYTYTLTAYTLKGNKYFEKTLSASDTFPQLAAPRGLTVTSDGTVKLLQATWYQSSQNRDGVELYRNNQLVYTAALSDPASWTDYTGRNDSTYTYKLRSFKFLQPGNKVVSSFTTVTKTYPSLYPPFACAVQPVSTDLSSQGYGLEHHFTKVSWSFSSPSQKASNFDGFVVQRSKGTGWDSIAFVDKRGKLQYTDVDGVPGTIYTYRVMAYKSLLPSWSSFLFTGTITYPEVPAPHTFTSASGEGFVQLMWTKVAQGVQGYLITTGTDSVWMGSDALRYHYVVPGNYNTNPVTFHIQGYRDIKGKRYFSVRKTVSGASLAYSGGTQQAATNFKASDTYSNHVQLSWDYPSFIVPTFMIYRNGVFIDSVNGLQRVYYDYSGPANTSYLYQVAAKYGNNTSRRVGDNGKRIAAYNISGQVASQVSRKGISGVTVTLMVTDQSNPAAIPYYFYNVKTDASGNYSIPINLDPGYFTTGKFDVIATENNLALTTDTVTIYPVTGTFDYYVNFDDTLNDTKAAPDTILLPKMFTAKANRLMQYTELHWTIDNPNYSGFKIYRGLGEIADVKKGEPMKVTDASGEPGYQYNYRIKAYWTVNGTTTESQQVNAFEVYPQIPAVQYLNAGNFNNYVKLQWSHESNRHTYYEVKRNGSIIGITLTTSQLSFTDSTGLPGQQYRYTVTPVLVNSFGTFRGPESSVSNMYPGVSTAEKLQLTVAKNSVVIGWNNQSNLVSSFKIYRDGALIATMPNNQNQAQTYADFGGVPNRNHEYAVACIYKRSGFEYASVKANDFKQFPVLEKVDSMTVVPVANEDRVQIRFVYKYRGADKFELTRTDATMGTVLIKTFESLNTGGNDVYVFDDITGVPGVSYSYTITARSVRAATLYSSAGSAVSGIFPALSAPINLTATKNSTNSIVLTWEHKSPTVTQFLVFRDGAQIATLDGKIRHYIDINQIDMSNCDNYQVQARKTFPVYGNRTSAAAAASGSTSTRNNQVGIVWACGNGYSSNHNYGTSLDFDGTKMIIGQPGSYGSQHIGSVYIYTLNNGAWTFEQQISDPSGTKDAGFGSAVAISGNRLIIGAPYSGSSFQGAVYVYDFNTGTKVWNLSKTFNGSTGAYSGYSVDIYGNYLIYGSPFEFNSTWGVARAFYWNGSSWIQMLNNVGNPNSYLGYSVAITDKWVAAGAIAYNSSAGQVFAYQNLGTSVGTQKTFNGASAGIQFGQSIDLENNSMVVGAIYGDANLGTVYYYNDLTQATPQQEEIWNKGTGNNTYDCYGMSVKLSGGKVLIGAPYHEDNGVSSETGTAYIYQRTAFNNWNIERTFLSPSIQNGEYIGYSVAMANNQVVLSAHNRNMRYSRQGAVFHYYKSGSSWLYSPVKNEISSVTASDGAYSNQVLVEWTFTGTVSQVSEFLIYRDEQLISSEASSKTKFFDKEAVPGKDHVYSVKPKYIDGSLSHIKSDIGYRLGNGKIEGTVVTYTGGFPVNGATVKATAKVGTDIVEYTTTSNVEGKYLFDTMYYGIQSTFTISVSYPGHFFDKDSYTATLDETQTTAFIQPFRDKTAFLLQGTVARRGMSCGLDSIRLRLDIYTSNGLSAKETKTNANGSYSFIIDPLNTEVLKYVLKISNDQSPGGNAPERYFHFDTDSVVYSNMSALSSTLVTTKNITDTLSYMVKVSVAGTCGLLGTNKYTLLLKSDDGCYEKTVTTPDNGILYLNIPPVNIQASVTGITPTNSNTIPIIDYFKVRPHIIPLADMFRDSLMDQTKTGKAIALIKEDFIYHKNPSIVIGGVPKYFCNNPQYPMIFTQGSDYLLQLRATETFGSITCDVSEGYFVVRNEGSDEPVKIINYNTKTGSFPDYSFKAGKPAIVEPYQRYLIVEYHTKTDGLLAELIKPMVITGISQQPGNDILVQNDGDGLQMPLYVLRDPPGDGSYSFVEEGTTFTRALSMSDENTGYVGISSEDRFEFFGVGGEVTTKFQGGGGSGRNADMSVTYTTTKRITTPDRSGIDNADLTGFLVGDQGDVIVGAGMSMKYGISDEVYLENDCQLAKRSIITVAPDGVKTTWVYTISQIEKIIKDLEYTLTDSNQIAVKYGSLSPEQGKRKIEALLDNWKNVLEYHRKASVPFIQLCDPANYASLPEPFKTQAINWAKNGFCAEVGTYSTIGGKTFFTLKDNVNWTTDLITKYKKVNQAVRDLSDDGYQANFPAGREFSQSRLDDINIDAEYTAQYGVDAENYTFSGGTAIENSVRVEKSKSRSYIQKTFFESELYAGLIVGGKITFSTGGGLGAIFLTSTPDPLDVENKLGITAGYNFSFEQNTTNTQSSGNTVGYKLTDNDIGDQFGVTIIRGVDPSHTPYFSLTGGRSSCPNEPGTIPRDQAAITLEAPDKTGFNAVQQGIDADVTVAYPVKLINLAPSLFNESRGFQLSLSENANQYGAKVQSQGFTLGETSFMINSGSYVYTNVYVTRAPGFYDFPDITLHLAPTCPENSVSYDGVDKNLEVYYRHPCSNISILEPGNNWLIRKAIPGAQNDPDEKMTIYLGDYDLQNVPLESVTLEYRRIGDPKGWTTMAKLTKKDLQDYYNLYKSTYRLPKYPYVWDIKGKADILDGDYEIRAYNTCGLEGFVYSNVIKGKIDRSTIVLYGTPEPSDGIYSLGDPDVSVTFNKEVECALISSANYTFRRKADSSIVNVSHSCFNNKIIFTFDDPISTLDGQIIQATLKNVYDKSGNKQVSPVQWEFEISNNPVYWLPQHIVIDVYRGNKNTVTANLFNTSSTNRNFLMSTKNGSAWLSGKTPFNYVPSVGVPVAVTIDAKNLQLGSYTDTLVADVIGFTREYLSVTVNVVARPPQWTVKNYENNAVVICNFELDSSGVLSSDTMDRIAAVIGNEVRGVSNIIKTGNYYRAYIPVSGSSADVGETIDFRIWDASSGYEYDGHPRASIVFAANAAYGTTITPQILDVNTVADSVRYIPLKKGWNWLAINAAPSDQNVNSVLRSLSSVNGDIIKTQTGSASYSEANKRWVYTSGGVSSVSPENGYLLKISKDDTLRLSGANAIGTTTVLNKGWNLIGNITQKAQPISDVYQFFNLSNKAILKNDIQVAEYDSVNKVWNGFTNILPNKSYLLRNGDVGTLTKRSSTPDSLCADFNPLNYEKTMNIFGVIKIDGVEMANNTDKVRVLVNNDCRGEAQLEYNAVLDRYVMDLVVYNTADNEELTFKIIRASGQEYKVTFNDTFVQNKTLGMPDDPYIFTPDAKNYNGITAPRTLLNTKVYPNPFENNITLQITANSAETAGIVICDLMGKEVLRMAKSLEPGANTFTISQGFETLPAGMYVLQIQTPSGSFRQKLIKL